MDAGCVLCGHPGLQVVRTRARRHGLARINPLWDPRVREYVVCPDCGARSRLDEAFPRG